MRRSLSSLQSARAVYTERLTDPGYAIRCEMRLVYLNYLANAEARERDRLARIANRVLLVSVIALGFFL